MSHNSLVYRLDEQCSIRIHYFDVGMNDINEWVGCGGVAWSIVKQQKNVEWDVLLQEVFLYLCNKVLEKPVLENVQCNPGFGVTLPHNRKRDFGYILKGFFE